MRNNRPIPRQTKDAEARITDTIAGELTKRHGPDVAPLVHEALSLLWPCVLQRIEEELAAIGGAANLDPAEHGHLVKGRKADAALALPGMGRLEVRCPAGRHDRAWLSLRLHTRAMQDFREVLK